MTRWASPYQISQKPRITCFIRSLGPLGLQHDARSYIFACSAAPLKKALAFSHSLALQPRVPQSARTAWHQRTVTLPEGSAFSFPQTKTKQSGEPHAPAAPPLLLLVGDMHLWKAPRIQRSRTSLKELQSRALEDHKLGLSRRGWLGSNACHNLRRMPTHLFSQHNPTALPCNSKFKK